MKKQRFKLWPEEKSITWLTKPLWKTALWSETHVCIYMVILESFYSHFLTPLSLCTLFAHQYHSLALIRAHYEEKKNSDCTWNRSHKSLARFWGFIVLYSALESDFMTTFAHADCLISACYLSLNHSIMLMDLGEALKELKKKIIKILFSSTYST